MATATFRAVCATLAGPLCWAAHFGLAYGFNGLFCARPAMQTTWLGLSVASWVVGAGAVLAVAAMALVHLRYRQRLPTLGNARFLPVVAGVMTALSALAVVWQTLPVFMLPSCG